MRCLFRLPRRNRRRDACFGVTGAVECVTPIENRSSLVSTRHYRTRQSQGWRVFLLHPAVFPRAVPFPRSDGPEPAPRAEYIPVFMPRFTITSYPVIASPSPWMACPKIRHLHAKRIHRPSFAGMAEGVGASKHVGYSSSVARLAGFALW